MTAPTVVGEVGGRAPGPVARRRPSMVDVGRLAGVSHQTVARVLRNTSYVSAETRARVLRAIDDLRYTPNRQARALALDHSDSIGVLTVGELGAALGAVLLGLSRAAHAAGYTVAIANVDVEPTAVGGQAAVHVALERFLAENVAGIVVVSAYGGVLEEARQRAAEVPIVLVFSEPVPDTGMATIDSYHGGALVAEHLLGLGHRRIGVVAGPVGRFDSAERERGFADALAVKGLAPLFLLRGDWSPASGYDAGLQLRGRADFTAVFTLNDRQAYGVVRAMREVDRLAPRDFSIVGYDDLDESAYLDPPLTTVHQDFEGVGRLGCARLLEAITTGRMTAAGLKPYLVERASTARP